MVSLICLCIAIEPLRYLLNWLLIKSSLRHHARRIPPIADFVNPCLSPLTYVRQFYAKLLSGVHPRLQLLLKYCGCDTMRELKVKHPGTFVILRRLLLTADSWVFRRHCREVFDRWPWKLVMLADPRVKQDLKLQIAKHLFKTNACCLDELLSRRLRLLFPWMCARLL